MSKESIINILEDYFLYAGKSDVKPSSLTANAIIEIQNAIESNKSTSLASDINLKDADEINRVLNEKKGRLFSLNEKIRELIQPISYFMSEMIDNMQQHSNVDKGYIFADYNKEYGRIELVLADGGISIYGSYINANKYTDKILNSDSFAVEIAKEGYSTKDRPEAENRGYGLSSNIKMITQGLKGDLAIMSGNALYVSSIDKMIDLPTQFDWKGTLILAIIPLDLQHSFNFYDFI